MSAQAVFLTSYVFYILALGLGMFYYRQISAGIQQGLVRTDSMRAADFMGVALVIGWYSLGFFAPKAEKLESIDPVILGVGIVTQLIPCGIVLMILGLRGVNISTLLNLRWNKFYFVFLIAPAGVLITYLFSMIISLLGYEAWMTSYFGNDAGQQDIITMYQATDAVWVRGLMAVMVVIIAPITEEVIFRGYIYPVTKKFTKPVFATLLTSLLFGVVHFNISALLPLVFLAIILNIAYEFTGSIWAPISIHALFNASTVCVLEFMKHHS